MAAGSPSATSHTAHSSAALSGVVKQVLSGDTLVLMGGPRPDGPPATRTVTIGGIVTPRLAIKTPHMETQDEPYAFAAREALRTKVIGEVVTFRVEYKDRDREFCTVSFKGSDLAVLLLSQGLAKIRGSSQQVMQLSNYATMVDAEAAAKEGRRGQWTASPAEVQESVRQLRWLQGDAEACRAFAAKHNNEKLKGIVEFVRDGGCLRVYIPQNETVVPVMLSGVQVDKWRRVEGYTEPSPEPFAEEARYFVEVRLLNRDVELRVEGADDFGNVIGTVIHPKGNIALLLLRNGFAKVHEGSVRHTETPAAYRQGQLEAQKAQVRKWRGFVPTAEEELPLWKGKVIEVLSGDCFCVLCEDAVTHELKEKRLYVASIRAPRMGTRNRPAGDPWAYEAKEFARKLLVGKDVQVKVEYSRQPFAAPGSTAPPPPPSDASGKMHHCSFRAIGKKSGTQTVGEDYALQAVRQGFCRIAPHRSDDPRAENYDKLCDAEKEAAEQKLRVHAPPSSAPKSQLNDLVGPSNTNKAKGWEPSMLRAGEMDGYVDHAFNGGRFKVVVPRENLAISFILGGIRVPQTARTTGQAQHDRQGEPFAEEALQYAREHFLQRDMKFKVEACDRGGNFIGVLYRPGSTLSANGAMVKAGLASLSDFPSPSIQDELQQALRDAKQRRVGIWAAGLHNDDDDEEETSASTMEFRNEILSPVIVTFVDNCRDFFIQDRSPQEVDRMQSKIQEHVRNIQGARKVQDQFSSLQLPKVGELVLCQFSEDDAWYRARIGSIRRDTKQVVVNYVDFGNSESRSANHLLRCPPELQLSSLPVAGRCCALAGLLPPPDLEEEGAKAFLDLAGPEDEFQCVVETIEKVNGVNLHHVRLAKLCNGQPAETTLAEDLLREGLAVVDRKAHTEYKAKLLQAESLAKKARLNVWLHGDVGGDDSDRDEPRRVRTARRT